LNKTDYIFKERVLSQTRMEMLKQDFHCRLSSFYLSLRQHATHFGGEIEAVTTALMQLFGRIQSSEKAVT
jgi:hypothetical protein